MYKPFPRDMEVESQSETSQVMETLRDTHPGLWGL